MSKVIHKLTHDGVTFSRSIRSFALRATPVRGTQTERLLSTGKQENKQRSNIEQISQDYVKPFTECWICVRVCVCLCVN